MKQLFKLVFLLIAPMLLTVSCTSTKKTVDVKVSLSGKWELKALNGTSVSDNYSGGVADIEFDIDKNMISGSAGCNRYSGAYVLSDMNIFSAPNLAFTMMACLDMKLENDFTKALQTNDMKVAIDGSDVLKFTKEGKEILVFDKLQGLATGNLPGEWVLTAMTDDTSFDELFEGNKPTLSILADGKAAGFAGCNRFNTSYTIDNDELNFKPAMSTKMACPSLVGEGKFLNLLSQVAKYSIAKNELQLLNAQNVVVLQFSKK